MLKLVVDDRSKDKVGTTGRSPLLYSTQSGSLEATPTNRFLKALLWLLRGYGAGAYVAFHEDIGAAIAEPNRSAEPNSRARHANELSS